MGAKRVTEDEVLVPVPRSALMVAAPPVTITQRNCLTVFGLSADDYLRLAGTAFPVKKEGRLRVAKFTDVESYLTRDATLRAKYQRHPRREHPAANLERSEARAGSFETFDAIGELRKAGFRPPR